MSNYSRLPNEPILDYQMRICGLKDKIGSWQKVADIINEELNTSYSESKYRRLYCKFNISGFPTKEEILDRAIVTPKKVEIKQPKVQTTPKTNTRILTISDLHVPYNQPCSLLEQYANKIDVLQINGDIVDCQALSKFPKAYRKSPIDEIVMAYHYLEDLIDYLNPSKVIVNIGNHDIRFQNYLVKNLDTDILELMPKSSVELILIDGFNRYDKETGDKTEYTALVKLDKFKDIKFEFCDTWYSRCGDAIFCHPLAFSSGILQTAEKARRYFKDEGFQFKYLIMAHTHRIGYYYVGDTRIYEQGAFCDTDKMNYSDGKLTRSQKQGYMYFEQDTNGNTIRDTVRQIELN